MKNDNESYVSQRQYSIVFKGISGIKPKIPVRLDALKEEARKRLPAGRFSYIATGSGRDNTLIKNKEAFQKWAILPRVLRNTTEVSTSIELFGKKHDYPFMLGPLGIHSVANKLAEPAVARAAASENIGMAFSSFASTPMEKVAAEMGNCTRWFQINWSTSEELNKSFIRRAEACGCSALVFTVDAPVLGWRTADLTLGYAPLEDAGGVGQYIYDPVFKKALEEFMKQDIKLPKPKINYTFMKYLLRLAYHYPGGFFNNLLTLRPQKTLMLIRKLSSERTMTWEEIVSARKYTNLPIILKGILNPEDAKLALKYGMDGVVVSNHGGRQLSGAMPTLEALPGVVEAINGKIPVMLDSGIRGASDIYKALALGAKAVFIGRPYLYALAIAGEEGVRELIQNLKAELEVIMTLSGCTSIDKITREMVTRLPA